jgi:UDP-N-acetylmuramyl pentapeptide phosphotransferase/UDP-N-acetylglucosamine-1-phosphate transferase
VPVREARVRAWLAHLRGRGFPALTCFRGGLRSQISQEWIQAQGLADTKIVTRFWIVAGILALCGLATLKIR